MSLKNVLSTYMIYSFVRELTKSWTETKAYKLGIIDDKGKLLKKASELKTSEEREAYTLFDRLIWNVKRTLEALPGGQSKIKSYAAAAYLLKENVDTVYADVVNLFEHNEKTQIKLMLEEIAGPVNVAAGVAIKQEPLKKKKERSMEKETGSVIRLRTKIAEAKVLKRVVRQGVVKKKATCPLGQILKDGRCVPETSRDKQRFVKAAKIRKRSLAGKSLAGALRKRTRSLRKRTSTGLV